MNNPKCPRCHKENAKVSPLYGVMIGSNCVAQDRKKRQVTEAPEFATQTQQSRIQRQRDDYEKDILPVYTHEGKPNPEFAKAFPNKAKELFQDYEHITGNEVKL